MTLTDYSAVADLLAAFGVIVSLLYVGYQVKESRKAVRAATAQARTDLGVQLISARWTSDIADLLMTSVDDPESLSKADKFKLKGFFTAHVRHCMNMFYQQQEGLLDEFWSHGVARVTVYWIRNYPFMVDEWESIQKSLPPEFVKFINDELENNPTKVYV
ncbi:MAG: hypothetical protein V3R65_01395 [Acidiferrobacterales bacterium]